MQMILRNRSLVKDLPWSRDGIADSVSSLCREAASRWDWSVRRLMRPLATRTTTATGGVCPNLARHHNGGYK
jgi:hypothetical protein